MLESAQPQNRLMSTNTSGYPGVSWHKGAGKWRACIRRNGASRHLGLFETAASAHAAYQAEARKLQQPELSPDQRRAQLLRRVKALYDQFGIRALSTPFLEKQKGCLYKYLRSVGLNQAMLLVELDLTEEYAAWRNAHRSYRGDVKPKWTWESAVARAATVVTQYGDLPTVQWFRTNGLAALTAAVHKSGRTWEDLRTELDLPPRRKFCESKNRERWLSQPEACFSDFLFDRGIKHKRGERYPAEFAAQTGKKWARYDVHFLSKDGIWINVEIWGEPNGGPGATLNTVSAGRYREMRAIKEAWHKGRPDFLDISYTDCYSRKRLAEYLAPFIGDVLPQNAQRSSEISSEKFLYRDKDELLQECRRIAAQQSDGIFPSESWLRRRGKYKDRLGLAHNSLAIYIYRWLGGMREVRALLGQEHASTIKWDAETVRREWHAFVAKTGMTPSQVMGRARIAKIPRDIVNEAQRIYRPARELGLLKELRGGRKLPGGQIVRDLRRKCCGRRREADAGVLGGVRLGGCFSS